MPGGLPRRRVGHHGLAGARNGSPSGPSSTRGPPGHERGRPSDHGRRPAHLGGPGPPGAFFRHNEAITFLGGRVTPDELWLIALAVGVRGLLLRPLHWTMLGLACLATSEDRGRPACGGSTPAGWPWVLSPLSGALAGVIGPSSGPRAAYAFSALAAVFALKGFVAMAMGGFGSIPGASPAVSSSGWWSRSRPATRWGVPGPDGLRPSPAGVDAASDGLAGERAGAGWSDALCAGATVTGRRGWSFPCSSPGSPWPTRGSEAAHSGPARSS